MYISKLKDINTAELRNTNEEAAHILHNVITAYNAIIQRKQQLTKQGDNKPLYVLLGEQHDSVSQKIAGTLLIKCLSETHYAENAPADAAHKPIVAALEHPITIKSPTPLNDERGNKVICSQSAANIDHLLNAHFSKNTPLTMKYFQMALSSMQHRLTTIFSDVARHDNRTLNLPNHADDGIDPRNEKGLHIRNKHMSAALQKEALKHDAPLAIQVCGQAHVNGGEFCCQKYGLANIYKSASQNTFCVFWEESCPNTFGLTDNEFFISRNMPERYISYNLFTKDGQNINENQTGYKLEDQYLQDFTKALQGAAPF